MNNPKIAIAAMIFLALSACQSGIEPAASSTSVSIRAIYRDSQCLSNAARIRPIRDADALSAWWQPLAKQQFPAKPLPESLAAIDFDGSSVFVLFMGSQPTAGYDIELNDDQARAEQGSLTILASWRQPSADTMLAQVMTSPCVVLAVQGGPYENVSVRNLRDETLITTNRQSLQN